MRDDNNNRMTSTVNYKPHKINALRNLRTKRRHKHRFFIVQQLPSHFCSQQIHEQNR